MFKKVLIANRGEIAVRIIRSLKEMGIKTVAIYSIADKESLHVQLADQAVCVGGNLPSQSYLNIKNILAAAVATGCEAIHPGYGFLSENAEFAKMCEQCHLTFIGPSAETIDQMGNKEHARQTMIKNHVPVTPGSNGFIQTANQAKEIAKVIGYPILLKAAAGGGGKGIRQVQSADEIAAKLLSAQKEAETDFGNGQMYLEKVMQNVKHIEVQIFRDRFGNCVYFPERDCSLQRNKQKVLEESPCELITDAQRQKLGEIAKKAANAVNYLGTGTIEFLMDEDHHFYFMEMNTRIQVEHTVTEMVTGVDLVKAQISVAAGEKLPFKQEDLKAQGHAIECRINAEDPARDFMPSVGSVDYLYLPIGNPGMRIDTSLYQGEQISPFYDSMLAKIVAHGQNRSEAISKMRRLLNEFVLKGITTNKDFHLAILDDPGFLQGTFTNTYLEKEFLPNGKESLLMKLYQQKNTPSQKHIKVDKAADDLVPDNLIIKCPKCQKEIFANDLDQYQTCPNCDYGFRIPAKKRLSWLVDEFNEWDQDLSVSDPLHFPNYQLKIDKAKKNSGLNEAVLTGLGQIKEQKFALAIMDPTFIMGSLGQMTGEKLTRLFEKATEKRLPVVLFACSGGARMQEGILSLMQMAKVTNAVRKHSEAGLLYLVILTDPTTGGVTASFASLGDITLAEPHAMVGFAGRRVIEQTIHQKIAADLQNAENVLKHGFIDQIVKRQDEKETINWLLKGGNAKCVMQ